MMPANSINAWECEACGCFTVAIHKHAGVTPMYMGCRAMNACGGIAISLGYPPLPIPEFILAELKWEWYKPLTRKELAALPRDVMDHVIRGGLLIREIEENRRERLIARLLDRSLTSEDAPGSPEPGDASG